MILISLFAIGCTHMDPGYRLSRGNSVFGSWLEVTKNILEKQSTCFYMDKLLAAESDEEKLDISNRYFPNSTITDLGDNRYGVYKGTSSQLELLFSTNGLAFDSPGAKWSIMFNIDKDYNLDLEKMDNLNKGLPPGTWTTAATLDGVYPHNCVLNIECIGENNWTIKSEESEVCFDIDFTLKGIRIDVLGTPGEMETYLGGKGSYSFYNEQNNSVHANMDFEIADDFVFIYNITTSKAGVLDMEVSKPDGTSRFDVDVRYISRGAYELSYGGSTEVFHSNFYY